MQLISASSGAYELFLYSIFRVISGLLKGYEAWV